MYAVIRTGGKQYRVSPGDLLVVEKLPGEAGAEVAFNEVLMLGGEGDPLVGAPLIEGAVVRATLVETRRGDKVKVFKKIRRQGYRRTKGHRQTETVLRVTGFEGAGRSAVWDGEVDLTPLATLRLRARNLAPKIDSITAPEASAPVPVEAEEAAPKRRKTAKSAPAPEAAPDEVVAADVVDTQSAAEAEVPAAGAAEADAAPKAPRRKKTKTDAAPEGDGAGE